VDPRRRPRRVLRDTDAAEPGRVACGRGRAPHHRQAVGAFADPRDREGDTRTRAAQRARTPQPDGEIVPLPMPALTQERRQELVKVVKKMAEECKVALRGARRDANEMMKEALKDGAITEDDERKGLKTVQE